MFIECLLGHILAFNMPEMSLRFSWGVIRVGFSILLCKKSPHSTIIIYTRGIKDKGELG